MLEGESAVRRKAGHDEYIPRFAALALDCVRKEYQHKLDHFLRNASLVRSPGYLHPSCTRNCTSGAT
jgi:hypothetical protein